MVLRSMRSFGLTGQPRGVLHGSLFLQFFPRKHLRRVLLQEHLPTSTVELSFLLSSSSSSSSSSNAETQGQHLVYHIYIDTGVLLHVLGHRCGGRVDTGVEIQVMQVVRCR